MVEDDGYESSYTDGGDDEYDATSRDGSEGGDEHLTGKLPATTEMRKGGGAIFNQKI